MARDLNGVQSPFGTWPPANHTYFNGGVQTIGLPPGTNTANLLTDSPPVDCSLATDPNCITNYGAPKGIQYPLDVPNPWIKSYDNPEYTNAVPIGPIAPGPFDAAHVDGWNFHDTYLRDLQAGVPDRDRLRLQQLCDRELQPGDEHLHVSV